MQLGESFRVATQIRWVVAIHHGDIQPLEIMQIACNQYGKCTFADPALLGGEGNK